MLSLTFLMMLLALLTKNSYQLEDPSIDQCPSQNFPESSEMILHYPSEDIVKFHKLRSLKYTEKLSKKADDIDMVFYKEFGYYMHRFNNFKSRKEASRAFIGLYHPDENVRLELLSSISDIDYINIVLMLMSIFITITISIFIAVIVYTCIYEKQYNILPGISVILALFLILLYISLENFYDIYTDFYM